MPDLEEAVRLLEDIGPIWDEATLKEEKQIVCRGLRAPAGRRLRRWREKEIEV